MASVTKMPYPEAHGYKKHADFVPIHQYGYSIEIQTGEMGALMKNGVPYLRIVGYGLS